jgi:hypothetical protein
VFHAQLRHVELRHTEVAQGAEYLHGCRVWRLGSESIGYGLCLGFCGGGLGFRVQGSGFRVQVLGFMVYGLGSRV